MKLLTHNMLTSPGNARGFPLKIANATFEEVETDFNAEFIARMVGKLEWHALLGALRDLEITHQLPSAVPEQFAEDEAFLKAVHHALVEVASASRARARAPLRAGSPLLRARAPPFWSAADRGDGGRARLPGDREAVRRQGRDPVDDLGHHPHEKGGAVSALERRRRGIIDRRSSTRALGPTPSMA